MRNPPNSDERSQGRTKVKRYYSMFTDKKTHYCQGVSSSNEYPGLSFRIDWFDLLAAWGLSSVPSLGWEDSLEEGRATHSSILA